MKCIYMGSKMIKKESTPRKLKKMAEELIKLVNHQSLLRHALSIHCDVSKKYLNGYVKFFQLTFNNGISWATKAL